MWGQKLKDCKFRNVLQRDNDIYIVNGVGTLRVDNLNTNVRVEAAAPGLHCNISQTFADPCWYDVVP
eukprot:2450228-Rhodomonas_salina.3